MIQEGKRERSRAYDRPVRRLLTVLILLGAAGCGREGAELPAAPGEHAEGELSDRSDGPSAEEQPAPDAPARELASTRLRGDVTGAFEPLARSVVVGEPLVVRFHVENRSDAPLAFSWGGDYRNSVGPLRFRWIVRDPDGQVECDLRATPPMGLGGIGTEQTVAPGGSYDRLLVLGSVCEALSTPGRHWITGVRVLTRDVYGGDHSELGETCDPFLPPDPTRDPVEPVGEPVTDECLAWLRSFPAVSSDFEIEVRPYDPERVREGARALLAREGDDWEEAQSRYGGWLCDRLGSECPGRLEAQAPATWLPPALEELPAIFPAAPPPRP